MPPDELPDLFGEPVRPPHTYVIPPDADRDYCAGPNCRAAMWWVVTPDGARCPVDVKANDCYRPQHGKPGLGRSHYLTCPDWKNFSPQRKS